MVYILLAEGFEEVEALAPCDMLKRADIDVCLVSCTGTLLVRGSHGIGVFADITLSEMNQRNMEMLVLPGGMPGTKNLDKLMQTDILVRSCRDNNRFIAAICAAPMILGNRGVLSGKRAICYPGFEKYLSGAEICRGERVVRDGNIITAVGCGAATEFGLELVAALRGEDAAEEIRKAIG